MRGFWLANWFNSARPDQITAMYDRLYAAGRVRVRSARRSPGTYRFSEIAEAVAVAAKNRGKALFTVG